MIPNVFVKSYRLKIDLPVRGEYSGLKVKKIGRSPFARVVKIGQTLKTKRKSEIHACVAGYGLIFSVCPISHYWRGHLHN